MLVDETTGQERFIAFSDGDVVAHTQWCERYTSLPGVYPGSASAWQAGGFAGWQGMFIGSYYVNVPCEQG
tara:strand:+ start:636 stop:845 length:210 start_codon:yes stop_codon:yes gene_type:complete